MSRRPYPSRTKVALTALSLVTAFSVFVIGCGSTSALPDDVDPDAGGEEIDAGPDGSEECTENCEKSCTTNAQCDDGDPCNGSETCDLATNECSPGLPLEDSTACGDTKACHKGVCGSIVCGDGYVDEGEECDDGNTDNGDGCDSCQFSCVSGDAERGCPEDACNDAGSCNDDHTCSPGLPKPDETSCGSAMVCRSGVCVDIECGNGIVEEGEDCDFGTGNGAGSGCEIDCSFSCASSNDCDDNEACNGEESCEEVTVNGASGKKCQAGTPLDEGADCSEEDDGKICKGGSCAAPNCGDGILDSGEDCDLGASNGPGVGCEANCKFSCNPSAPNACDDGNVCTGTKTCEPHSVDGETVYKCSLGSNVPNCTQCGSGVCQDGTCAVSVCGDGCVDSRKGEQCELPNSGTCDASCHFLPVCGNGTREAGEQCDDGNKVNLDGCDSSCQFEQVHRINHLKMQWTTDSFCSKNALGGAIASSGQSTLTDALDGGVKDGSVSVLFKFFELPDLTGTSASNIRLGAMNASPVEGATYDGTSDLDWWYIADPGNIDANRNPTAFLNGGITAKKLTAGPGNITLNIVLAGAMAPLSLSNTSVEVVLGATSKPQVSAGTTPGHLASTKLDPALVSFASGGEKTANSTGKLCGYVSAYSLSKVPVPEALTTGLTKCSANYTVANNSMLDVLINGCSALGGLVSVIKKAQPDQVSTSAPSVGNGGPYSLSVNGSTKKVEACKDKNGTVVDLEKCLQSAAYSSFFKFATGRVIAKAE